METNIVKTHRVCDWKGLIHGEARKTKVQTFAALFLVASAMTFMQLGFIGVGGEGKYVCYVMGLLVPVAATALLLGKGAGALQGFLCGIVLFVHAIVQPLNPVERYFVSGVNSFVLYTFAGFLLGLCFAIALRSNPKGVRRIVYLGIGCTISAVVTTAVFTFNILLHLMAELYISQLQLSKLVNIPPDVIGALNSLGNLGAQCMLDFALLLVTAILVSAIVQRYNATRNGVSVRVSFGIQLFVVVSIVFCVLSALSYVSITLQAAADARNEMDGTLHFIGDQFVKSEETTQELVGTDKFKDIPKDTLDAFVHANYLGNFVDGYDLANRGTVVVFRDNKVLHSNSPAYPEGMTTKELFGEAREDYIANLVESGETSEFLYTAEMYDDTENYTNDYRRAELGYIRAQRYGSYDVMVAVPFSVAFSTRNTTMAWSTMLSFWLLAVVYFLTARLLGKDVVSPIDRTNERLAQITNGDLEVRVQERDSVEFTSLSDGINSTVTALSGYIEEAESRMERELATAKAIQKSALPRVFPPFPEVDKFDIFASMNAAKEVGGDFYDYFLIDDHTLGFLIADVSGKGVPGALFMMAAKTELENYMSTGMELSQAIATANMRLCANNDAGMFVTVWAATLDYNTGELTYVNAGHNFPLLRHGFNGEWEWLKKKCGLFLGTFEMAKYRQETIMLKPGDELLLYTDGVNEAFNVNEEEYSNERLEEFVAAHSNMHSREIVRSLRADVARWAEGAEQSDDVTILALEYGVKPEVTGSITVTATIENLEAAVAMINNELEARLCPLDVQHKVEVAVEELFVNVCRYAYADKDEPGKVQVRYAYGTDPSAITVELRDKGMPFDPMALDPERDSAKTGDGGLGILMARRSMDDFTYMRSGDTNVVVIKKGW